MHIDTSLPGLTNAGQRHTGKSDRSGAGPDFAATLARTRAENAASPPARAPSPEEKAAEAEAAREALWAEFRAHLEKTPAERMREWVLKTMGISEAELAAMPPEKRMAVEAEIAERIREKLLGRQEKEENTPPPPGSIGQAPAGLPGRELGAVAFLANLRND